MVRNLLVFSSTMQKCRILSGTSISWTFRGFRISPQIRNYRPRRALMYVPGNDVKKINKISSINADCAVMDCEDGVAINKKTEAREIIREMLEKQDFGRTERSVRINGIDTGLAEEDLRALFGAKRLPESIVVPKVESDDQILWLTEKLSTFGSSSGRPDEREQIYLIFLIESARALLDMDRLCFKAADAFSRTRFALDAVIFGSDDFSANIGATRTKDANEVLYARQHFVLVAKAHKLQAIDMVYIDYKDVQGLEAQSISGAQMGFTGKQVIHPGQVPIVHKSFSPSPEKVEWATNLIKAFDEHQQFGKGAFTFRGSMIDMPSLLQAKNVVQMTKLIKND